MRLSISEIVTKAQQLQSHDEKVQWLKKYDNVPLRQILHYTYDRENIKFLIPDTPPPWKKNSYIGVEGMLYNEARRLRIFIEGGGYDNLNSLKREHLFISLLEDIDNKDAELLTKMIAQKPLPGLPLSVLKEAFPETFTNVKEIELTEDPQSTRSFRNEVDDTTTEDVAETVNEPSAAEIEAMVRQAQQMDTPIIDATKVDLPVDDSGEVKLPETPKQAEKKPEKKKRVPKVKLTPRK